MARIPVDLNIYNKRGPRALDTIIGLKFGRLTTVTIAGHNKSGSMLILCKCECGNEAVVVKQNLKKGKVKSCGCLMREKHSNDLESAVLRMLRNKATESGLDPDVNQKRVHAQRIQFKSEST